MAINQKTGDDAYKIPLKSLMSLEGKTTVVTGGWPRPLPMISLSSKAADTFLGGGRGIGLALARQVAELGGDVAVLDFLKEPHKDFYELEKDFGVKVRYVRYRSTRH